MHWDTIYSQLEQELGHEPTAEQVQARMLEEIGLAVGVNYETRKDNG